MKIGKTRIDVVDEPITGLETAGIVNPANDMLWMGGGVSAEIRKAGGESIEQEAIAQAPAEIGSVVVTGAVGGDELELLPPQAATLSPANNVRIARIIMT